MILAYEVDGEALLLTREDCESRSSVARRPGHSSGNWVKQVVAITVE